MAGPDIDSEANDGLLGEAAWHAVCRSQFVIELSPEGTVLDVNGKLARALGHPRAAMIGRPHRNFFAPREGAGDADPGAPHRVIAYRTADGGELLVQATTSSILDSAGVPVRALVIGVDVTDRGQLLSVARQDAGVPTDAVDLAAHLAACVNLVRPLAARRVVTVRCDVAPELPRWIACDAPRLRQMVLAMLSAAIEPVEGGVVALAAEPAWDDPQVLAISVSAPGAKPGNARGSGLAIAGELARSLGGILACTDLRAELRLPLTPACAHSAPPDRYPVSIAPDRRHDRPRVLVADDDPVGRALALDQLARVGAWADVAPNGAMALAMVAEAEAASDPYRLVMMDTRMPVMDGREATRRLRANGHTPARLPVIALTVGGLGGEREANLAAGMQDTLAKPVALAELAHAIDCWAPERRRYRRADTGSTGTGPLFARG